MLTTLSLRVHAGLLSSLEKAPAGPGEHSVHPYPGEDVSQTRADLTTQTAKDPGMAKAFHKYSKLRMDTERVLARRKPEVKEITRLPDRLERMTERAKELTQEAMAYGDRLVSDADKQDPRLHDARLKMFSAAEVATSGVALVDMPADREMGRPARTVSMSLKQMKKEAKETAVRVKELEAEGRPEAAKEFAAFELDVMRAAGKKLLQTSVDVEHATANFLRQVERVARKGRKK